MARPRRTVFVTVGMGPWPFDRLVRAIEALTVDFDVFAQVGTTSVVPPCAHADFIDSEEFERRLVDADIVVTHAGNTLRQVQRLGKVPIAVARVAVLGEMANDHQVRFLDAERNVSPVIVAGGQPLDLVSAVGTHLRTADRLVEERVVPAATDASTVRRRLAPLARDRGARRRSERSNPLIDHPTRRLSWAFAQLADLDGPHLELGCGTGELARELGDGAGRPVVGADPSPDALAAYAGRPGTVVRIGARDPLPFASGAFASVSMLDALEHVWDESAVLGEVVRVMAPGAELVLTVPRRHVLSAMDPDNAKFRWPRIHRRIYSWRFGADRFHARFADLTNGMRGDLAVERSSHEHYTNERLVATVQRAGLVVHTVDAANLFWRLADVPRLLLPNRFRPITHSFLLMDGRRFHQANLYVAATKPV